MWAIILSLLTVGGAVVAIAMFAFFSVEGNSVASQGPKKGGIVHETMACSKLDDLKHARALGETSNLMAALTYALTHNCAVLDEGMRVKVDKETEGSFACVRPDTSEACLWTMIGNVEIQ